MCYKKTFLLHLILRFGIDIDAKRLMTDNLCCDFINKFVFNINAILIIYEALRRYFSVEENLFFTLKIGFKA